MIEHIKLTEDDKFVEDMNYLFDAYDYLEMGGKGKLVTESLILNQYYDYKMSRFFRDDKFLGGRKIG